MYAEYAQTEMASSGKQIIIIIIIITIFISVKTNRSTNMIIPGEPKKIPPYDFC